MKKRRRSKIVPAVVFSTVLAGAACVMPALLGGCDDSGSQMFSVADLGFRPFDVAARGFDFSVPMSVADLAFKG